MDGKSERRRGKEVKRETKCGSLDLFFEIGVERA